MLECQSAKWPFSGFSSSQMDTLQPLAHGHTVSSVFSIATIMDSDPQNLLLSYTHPQAPLTCSSLYLMTRVYLPFFPQIHFPKYSPTGISSLFMFFLLCGLQRLWILLPASSIKRNKVFKGQFSFPSRLT